MNIKGCIIMSQNIYVETKSGTVMGSIEGHFREFKGIPYAKAKRFEAPKPVQWDNMCDCTAFGKKAMQVIDHTAPWGNIQTRDELDENCLNLNIYVPADNPAIELPVLIEVHGGAFQNGSNQEHTAVQMIRNHSFIYVSINYRLGIFGFLYLGALAKKNDKYNLNTSGNLGLMDIMSAVKWIYENISAFGGDPERITLMGSSAGAKAIGALLCTRDINKYIHQIILSSGATQSIRDVHTAGAITDKYMDIISKVAGIDSPGLQDLINLPADVLIEAQKILCDNPGNTCMFGPVADGIFLPENIHDVTKNGTFFEGNAMIGSSFHELAFYKMMDPDFVKNAPDIARALFGENAESAYGDFDSFCAVYKSEHGSEPSPELCADEWVRILTDYMYRTYSYRLAKRLALKGCRVWQYSVAFFPALHCFDQRLAFEDPIPAFFQSKEHMESAKTVGNEIYKSFVCFIEKGFPAAPDKTIQWPCLSPNTPVQMVWNEDSCLCPVHDDDVLQGIGEAVYQL